MRNAVINKTSPREDIVGVLTGVWNEYDAGVNKEFHVVKTPFYIAITGTLSKGPHVLPVVPNNNSILRWVSKDSSGNILVKVGQKTVDIPENAFVELTYYGTMGGNDSH